MTDSGTWSISDSGLDEPESQLLGLLSECSGSVDGRKKLMKLLFFSEYYDPETDRLQPDERLGGFTDFTIYKYGPFSRKVMDAFDELKERGLVEEETTLTFSGNRKKEVSLTDEGRRKAANFDRDRELLSVVADKLGDENGSELERISLSMLGIEREEKEEYRGTPVSDIIAS